MYLNTNLLTLKLCKFQIQDGFKCPINHDSVNDNGQLFKFMNTLPMTNYL